MELEAYFEDITSAVEEDTAPTVAERVAVARRNASIEHMSDDNVETEGQWTG